MSKKRKLATWMLGLMFASGIQSEPVKQGGTLAIPIINTGFAENFNPYTTKDLFHGVMFEPLFVFNNMTGKTHYRLAESVKYTEDLKIINLKIRDNLNWSDGFRLTAKDVEFSFNMMKKFPIFDLKKIWSKGKLTKVEAIDDLNVVFTLSEADSTLLWDIAAYHVVPMHIWSKVKDILAFTNPDPVGSGPMTTVSLIEPLRMELCRNPNYYLQGRPYLDCIHFRSYKDNIAVESALIKGEIDWNSSYIPYVESNFVARNQGGNHFWYPANNAINLYINSKIAPFDDLNVRQALSMAINREELVEIGFLGYPTVNYNAGGIGEFHKIFIDEKVNKKYEHLTQYKVRKARALLEEVGVIDRNNDGYRDNKDGSEINFDIEVVEGWTNWIKVAQMLQSYFYDIGFKANVKVLSWSEYLTNLQEGKYSMSISWSKATNNPITTYREYYHSSLISKGYHVNHGINSAKIDSLIDSFTKTGDEKKQQAIISQLQMITAETLPFIPLFSNPTWFQYSTQKLVGWPNEKNPYVQPVWRDGGKRVLIINNLQTK